MQSGTKQCTGFTAIQQRSIMLFRTRQRIVMPTSRHTSSVLYNWHGPGIEPRTTACQADVLTTTLLRLCNDRFNFLQYTYPLER